MSFKERRFDDRRGSESNLTEKSGFPSHRGRDQPTDRRTEGQTDRHPSYRDVLSKQEEKQFHLQTGRLEEKYCHDCYFI